MRQTLRILLCALIILTGCSARPSRPYVSLTNLDPTLAAGAQAISPRPVLRVGLATGLSPRESLLQYGPLVDYLGRTLDRAVEIELFRSQTEALDVIRSGGVQLAFVGSYAFVKGEQEFGLEALAVPVYQGRSTRDAYILVRRYSGLIRFADLKGHTFAYTDPVSAEGRLFPEQLIRDEQEQIDRFFDQTLFVGTAEKAIRALDQGMVDGAAVESALFELATEKDPDLLRRLRVIAVSDSWGGPPVVVSPRLGSGLKRQLQDALLALDGRPEGAEVLALSRIERFALVEPADYDPLRRLALRAGGGR